MRVKVCGVTREADAELACELGAWAVGLIFVGSSPRAMDVERARLVRRKVLPGTLAVGVFADEAPETVRRIAGLCRLDAVQLHGSESPEACAEAGVPAYKALTLATTDDLASAERYAGRAAGLVIETHRRGPHGRERLGDAVRRQRWELAHRASRYASVILAGELTAENVREAVRSAWPSGVDVSGGVESSPGVKDPARLRAFFEAVRKVETQ